MLEGTTACSLEFGICRVPGDMFVCVTFKKQVALAQLPLSASPQHQGVQLYFCVLCSMRVLLPQTTRRSF